MSEKIIVNVASYRRTDSLIKTLKSIIDQCDEINIALNDHYNQEIPEFLLNDKINIYFTDNSLGDAFKFLKLEKSDGYFFTIDDDLIYPSNYIEQTIKKCKEFNNTKVMTYHGRNFKSFPITSYYKSASERYACLETVRHDIKVQFGGTGVMCFHTSLFKLPISYFKHPNMADVWIGKYCLENNIEIICLNHTAGYIKYTPQKTTIYNIESKSDGTQTQIVNSIFNKNESSSDIINKHQTHQNTKIQKTLEINKKTIDYQKVNRIFSNLQNNTQQKPQVNTNNLKLNSKQISTFNKKKFR